ncbi:alpha/beta hydrolase [Halorussus halophilus]|uniref:alpha/beta hydrolase n=1 Tax=Halorussus halophilus TaxID=2650975 RepID=UPI001300DD1E|nr:alpha/beta hydrolase [Halorussus halophilus]
MRTELHPEAAAVVEEIEAAGVPEWSAMSVESARRVEDEVFSGGNPPEVAFVRDLSIPGSNTEIPVRVYHDDPDEQAPVLVYYHGGGWVLGTLDSIGGVCRRLARRGECVVVSVDYRLAPENTFPAAVDDAYAAVEWVVENAETFGGDPEKVAVGGTSAGGNLATVTALRTRETDEANVAHQFLFYPITDYAFDTDSYAENGEGPLLTERDMRWFWDHYLRSEVDGANPYASPLRAPDLSGVPPATVLTCGFDPLRDEGVAYVERLREADVEVSHDHHPDMPHGFLSMSESVGVADEALEAVGETLRNL